MDKALFVALGGALGTLARYLFGVWALRTIPLSIPAGTLGVNLIGCGIAGVFYQMTLRNPEMSVNIRLFVMVGILGGFTTFSAFSAETLGLLQTKALTAAFLNMGSNLVGSLASCALGATLTRWLLS